MKLRLLFSFDLILSDHNPDPLNGMILFSGLSRFSGHFGGDGPSPLNRDTTVFVHFKNVIVEDRFFLPVRPHQVYTQKR